MLAGLSNWPILRTLPCFWANAVSPANIGSTSDPARASTARHSDVAPILHIVTSPCRFLPLTLTLPQRGLCKRIEGPFLSAAPEPLRRDRCTLDHSTQLFER